MGQRPKMKEAVVGEAQMRDNPEGDELDPALEDHRHCKKNYPSI